MGTTSYIYLMIILFASCNATEKCSFSGNLGDYDENPVEVISGDDNMKKEKLSDLKMALGNTVKVQCKNADSTIGTTGLRDQEVSCAVDQLELKLEACHAPCDLSSVKFPGTNNKIKNKDDPAATGATGTVPLGDKPVLYCDNDKYRIFDGLSEENTDFLQCSLPGPFVPVTWKIPASVTYADGFITYFKLTDDTAATKHALSVTFKYTKLGKEIQASIGTSSSECGPAINDFTLKSPLDLDMNNLKTWDITYTLVDNGAGNGMKLQYLVSLPAPALPAIDVAVTLDDDCRTLIYAQKDVLESHVYAKFSTEVENLPSMFNTGTTPEFHKLTSDGSYEAFVGGNVQLETKFLCIPVPEFTKDQETAREPNTMTLSIELDANRDDNLAINNIELKGIKPGGTDPELLCEIASPAKPTNVFTCDYTESDTSKLKDGITDIKATMTIGEPDLGPVTFDKNILLKAYAGPPAVIDGMVTEVSATGTNMLTVKWDAAETDIIFQNMATEDYVIMFGVSVVDSSDASIQLVDLGSYDYSMIKQINYYDFSLASLDPGTVYSFQVMTYLKGHTHTDGGKWTEDFTTGRKKPTLESASKSDTVVTVTVTLAETGENGDVTIKYTVTDSSDVEKKTDKKAFTFANSVTTFDVEGLEKDVSYEIDLIVYLSDDTSPPSETVEGFLATSGCSALDPDWDNLIPLTKVLAKDEEIDVECKPGFINKGGSKVTCVKDAQFVVDLAGAPDCVSCDDEFPEYIPGGHRISIESGGYGIGTYATYECYMPFIMNPNEVLMTHAQDNDGHDVTVAYKKMYNCAKCLKSQLHLPKCVDHEEAEHCGLPTEIENGHVVEFLMNEDGKENDGNDDAKLPRWAKYKCEDGYKMHETIKGDVGFCRKDGSMEIPWCEEIDEYTKTIFKLQSGNVKKLQRVDGTVFSGVVLAMNVDKDDQPYPDSEWEYGCNDGVNNYAAGAICRSLGFGSGMVIPALKKMMAAKHKFGWTKVSCEYDDTLMSSDHCHAMRYDEALEEYGTKEATCFHKFDIAAVKCFDNKWKMETSVKVFRKKMACLTQFMKEDVRMNLQDMGTTKVEFLLDDIVIETGDVKYKPKKGFFTKVDLVEKEYSCASCKIYVDDTLLDSAKWCKQG